jgi:hypothetical protein
LQEFESELTNIPQKPISLWLKIPYTLFVALIVVVYWRSYGPSNLLWFSDIGLLMAVPALWLENSRLASMVALGTVVLESLWTVDFLVRVVSGVSPIGLSYYMFAEDKTRFLRGLSFFHVIMPILALWMLYRLGYDRRALISQTMLCWVVLLFCYFFTDPSKNINLVFGFGDKFPLHRGSYFIALMIFDPLVIYLPTHFALRKLFAR